MSQSFTETITGVERVALKTLLPNNDMALLTDFSGATAPATTWPYMRWADTTTGLLKRRNAGNSGWNVIGPLNGNTGRRLVRVPLGTVNATSTTFLIAAPSAMTVVRFGLWSDTTSSGSSAGATEYQFQLTNLTGPVNLFSATVGTGTTLGGVGGGEITANVAYWLLANQNADLAASDLLKLVITKVGSPTSLTTVVGFLDAYERG